MNAAPIPGLAVCEATHDDFVSSMAGDLDLAPLKTDELKAKLIRAGFVVPESDRSAFREATGEQP